MSRRGRFDLLLPVQGYQGQEVQCLGYCQLYYILGRSLGLRVVPIDVLELAFGHLPPGEGHVGCCVRLTDGKAMVAEAGTGTVSKAFVFPDIYRAVGNYWELRQGGNPLGLHRRIQLWDKSGLVAAIYGDLAERYVKAGDVAHAISFLTTAIELNPKDAAAYSSRAGAREIGPT